MFREFEAPKEVHPEGPPEEEVEKEGATSYLIILRHAPRYAGRNVVRDREGNEVLIEDSTEITPLGEMISQKLGACLKELQADWVAFYGSTEKRTLQTGDWAAVGLVTKKPKEGEKIPKVIKPKTRPFFGYEKVLADLAGLDPKIVRASKVIQENLPPEFLEVDVEERARIRENVQPTGFRSMLEDERIQKPLAEAMAYRLSRALEVLRRKVERGTTGLMAQVGHGVFFEALCKEALVRELPDGRRKNGFDDIDEIGGFLKPGEYFAIKMTRLGKVEIVKDEQGNPIRRDPGGEKLEFSFNDPNRLKDEKYWLDLRKIEELSQGCKQKIKNYYERE